MNELNKLIEQWGESKNSPSLASSFKSMIAHEHENGGSPWLDFINFMLASRPTCGKEQRKFLDYIETMDSKESIGHPYIDTIWQDDTEADLQKVIKGK